MKPVGGLVLEPEYFHPFMGLFAEAYENMVNEKPITCAVSGKQVPPVVPPEAMIMDVSQTYPHSYTREVVTRRGTDVLHSRSGGCP